MDQGKKWISKELEDFREIIRAKEAMKIKE